MMRRSYVVLAVTLLCGFCAAASAGKANVVARDSEVSPGSAYVPVPLDDHANDMLGVTFPDKRITVDGIPFDLVDKPGANNVFLKDAGWSDWEQDPGEFCAAYDGLGNAKRDPHRLVFHVPVADYSAVHLLAATDNSDQYSPVVSFRIGQLARSSWGAMALHDFSFEVPRMADPGGDKITVPTEVGNLFLVRVPLGKAIAQDFQNLWALDVDVTKELRLAITRSSGRMRVRPLGLLSGVRIFGMTFERAPVQMEVRSTQPGYVFNEPDVPAFQVTLRKMSESVRQCSIEAVATHYYGEETIVSLSDIAFPQTQLKTVTLAMDVPKRGHHHLSIRLNVNGQTVLRRETDFALLPPDTRQHRHKASFGVWDNSGGHVTPDDPDLVGPLYVKAGLRYGMFGFSDEVRQRYGVVKGNDSTVTKGAWGPDQDFSNPTPEGIEKMAESVRESPTATAPKRLMIFHEHQISGDHEWRVPDLFTGREPYRMNEKEQERFRQLRLTAEVLATAIRKHFPTTEIYFGNGWPNLLAEFCRSGFPAELMGSRGSMQHTFMRMPEHQPPDFVANNAGLWMDRMVLDHYGYEDTPLRQCYETTYPSTNPGNLSLRTQANYYVRHLMHSLAWRIPITRFGMLTDVGNSYYFAMWGSSGLCHGLPDVRPKPAYVALATMSLLLDGAEFTRVVPTGSPVVYAAEFRRPDGAYVTCFWTVRRERELEVRLENPTAALLTDLMGNERRPEAVSGGVHLRVSPEPVFLTTATPAGEIRPGAALHGGRPEGEKFMISALGDPSEWAVEGGPNRELENYNLPNCLRRQGNFEYEHVEDVQGERDALRVRPILPVEGSEYLPMYSVLRHNEGVQIPGEPTEIGLMVNGNGGWGRIIFELQDASGQRWISIGAERSGAPPSIFKEWLGPEEFAKLDSANVSGGNTNDAWGRSSINFEGWRCLKFPLPGNYPGEGYHWPYASQWRHSGDGVVHYPLTFKKLIITLPEKVLQFKDYSPVPRQDIYLKDLMVTYRPPEEAFVAE